MSNQMNNIHRQVCVGHEKGKSKSKTYANDWSKTIDSKKMKHFNRLGWLLWYGNQNLFLKN